MHTFHILTRSKNTARLNRRKKEERERITGATSIMKVIGGSQRMPFKRLNRIKGD